jgi:hypothetical protein
VSDAQVLIYQIAQLPDDEFELIVSKVQRLETACRGASLALADLRAQLNVKPVEMPSEKEDPAVLSLCASCANPCVKAGPDIFNCRDYSQLTELCKTCVAWDVNTCQSADPCIDGELYVELGSEGSAQEGVLENEGAGPPDGEGTGGPDQG